MSTTAETRPDNAREIRPLRIGNASGFYGDRFAAMREMLTGGPLDVLTGDYLAELTMLILGRQRLADPKAGYARTFLKQLEECLGLATDHGVRIVSNAGGLNPAGLAEAVSALADRLGLAVRVGYVTGDDLRDRAGELGWPEALTANAYLGGWGIAECLRADADVVITGRVTDASLVVGPAAAHFGWRRADFDALAGATVAGHVLECGAQATGGNFSFFTELGDLGRPGFPIAEVHADGSAVITKHPDTGGAVSVETVTAQLLYEIGGPAYFGPDVTARFDTLTLAADGPDRVRIAGVRGESPPNCLKVAVNTLDGFRNSVTFVLCGLDIEAKAELVRGQLGGEDVTWTLARVDRPDADTEETASALLHATVRTPDAQRAKAFARSCVELALSSVPGFTMTAPPADGAPVGVYHDGFVSPAGVRQVAVLPDGAEVEIPATLSNQPTWLMVGNDTPEPLPDGPTRRVPLGTVFGARSGDKGGNANLGVWAHGDSTGSTDSTDRGYRWLAAELTVDRLRELLPEARDLDIERYEFANLRAVNFVLRGLLGQGVAASTRFDPQAKALGEWFRSRLADIPESLLPPESPL
ncbi:MAG TPA: acyclic terpene utilization AtuA family protein [Pseudonocardiaceae bacterium]|jgi:hypothetical protein|nr:acyclic terpene utilization AtuA family protein [Pseudonocardiaceae bacterium]